MYDNENKNLDQAKEDVSNIDKSDELINSEVDYKVEFSDDLYSAFLSVKKFGENAKVKVQDILDVLRKNNVVYGIDQTTIALIAKDDIDVDKIEVAKGDKHIDGKDSVIEYKFDLSNSKPKINEDGSIDFKNIGKFVSVYEGDLLAVKKLPTKEKNGINVFGKIVLPKKGRLKNFKFGKNVMQTEDGMRLIATKNGSVELVGDRVSVLDVLEIVDDVGPKTGNIVFSGKLIIYGNVLTGYSISAQGDVLINGTVEGATINCEGNLTVNSGIQGQGVADIIVKGDVVAKFINNAKLNCMNLHTNSIIHSVIHSNDTIIIENKKGVIIGGYVYAKHRIIIKQIGTEMGTKTKIAVGMLPEYLFKKSNIRRNISKLQEKKEKLDKLMTILKNSTSTKVDNIEEQIQKVMASLNQVNSELLDLENTLSELEEEMKQLKKSFVRADVVHNGVMFSIDNATLEVDSIMYRTNFKFMKGEIYTTNY